MIPLGDADRRPVSFPLITAVIIAINVLAFILELAKGEAFIIRWSFVPSEISSGQKYITLLTAMFMHGGWLHIIGNMVYFWAFGPEIEEMMGKIFYPIFYLSGGLLASLAQVLIDPHSSIPNLGASGAIASVMGAFLISFPTDRIRTLLIIGFFVTVSFIPAVVLVGFWFVIQLFSEVGALVGRRAGGIAYMAHIGGFVFGMASARLLRSRKKRTQQML
jgi:membrane associated rhomboid family serine protease